MGIARPLHLGLLPRAMCLCVSRRQPLSHRAPSPERFTSFVIGRCLSGRINREGLLHMLARSVQDFAWPHSQIYRARGSSSRFKKRCLRQCGSSHGLPALLWERITLRSRPEMPFPSVPSFYKRALATTELLFLLQLFRLSPASRGTSVSFVPTTAGAFKITSPFDSPP